MYKKMRGIEDELTIGELDTIEIPDAAKLSNLAELEGIRLFEGIPQVEESGIELLLTGPIEKVVKEFSELVKSVGSSVAFMTYLYLCNRDVDEFMATCSIDIESEITREDFGSSYTNAVKLAKKYNDELSKLDVTKPFGVELFVISSTGMKYTQKLYAHWSSVAMPADEALEKIEKGFMEELMKLRVENRMREARERDEERQRVLSSLEATLLADSTFIGCTTKAARTAFAEGLIVKNGWSETFKFKSSEIAGIADLAWAKLKGGNRK